MITDSYTHGTKGSFATDVWLFLVCANDTLDPLDVFGKLDCYDVQLVWPPSDNHICLREWNHAIRDYGKFMMVAAHCCDTHFCHSTGAETPSAQELRASDVPAVHS